MLGVKTSRELISGIYAKEIREALRRSLTGQLNAKETAAKRRREEANKHWNMEWKS